MREIKFRGRKHGSGEWVYGCAVVFSENLSGHKIAQIIQHKWHGDDEFYNEFVEPKTVGEFTGLQDEDGMDVYDGDIIQATNGEPKQVAFRSGKFQAVRRSFDDMFLIWQDLSDALLEAKVIGNVFEEPEIMYSEEGRIS